MRPAINFNQFQRPLPPLFGTIVFSIKRTQSCNLLGVSPKVEFPWKFHFFWSLLGLVISGPFRADWDEEHVELWISKCAGLNPATPLPSKKKIIHKKVQCTIFGTCKTKKHNFETSATYCWEIVHRLELQFPVNCSGNPLKKTWNLRSELIFYIFSDSWNHHQLRWNDHSLQTIGKFLGPSSPVPNWARSNDKKNSRWTSRGTSKIAEIEIVLCEGPPNQRTFMKNLIPGIKFWKKYSIDFSTLRGGSQIVTSKLQDILYLFQDAWFCTQTYSYSLIKA